MADSKKCPVYSEVPLHLNYHDITFRLGYGGQSTGQDHFMGTWVPLEISATYTTSLVLSVLPLPEECS